VINAEAQLLAAQAAAGSALQFDGVNGWVSVTNASDLNSYPFTATAWFTLAVVGGTGVPQAAVSSPVACTVMLAVGMLLGAMLLRPVFASTAVTVALSV
jgi:hypothetical protein